MSVDREALNIERTKDEEMFDSLVLEVRSEVTSRNPSLYDQREGDHVEGLITSALTYADVLHVASSARHRLFLRSSLHRDSDAEPIEEMYLMAKIKRFEKALKTTSIHKNKICAPADALAQYYEESGLKVQEEGRHRTLEERKDMAQISQHIARSYPSQLDQSARLFRDPASRRNRDRRDHLSECYLDLKDTLTTMAVSFDDVGSMRRSNVPEQMPRHRAKAEEVLSWRDEAEPHALESAMLRSEVTGFRLAVAAVDAAYTSFSGTTTTDQRIRQIWDAHRHFGENSYLNEYSLRLKDNDRLWQDISRRMEVRLPSHDEEEQKVAS